MPSPEPKAAFEKAQQQIKERLRELHAEELDVMRSLAAPTNDAATTAELESKLDSLIAKWAALMSEYTEQVGRYTEALFAELRHATRSLFRNT